MNPYDTLGVPSTATDAEIRSAYRSLAKTHHPDKGGDSEHFAAINAAHELLIDPDRRAYFDATGSSSFPKASESEARTTFGQIVVGLILKDVPDIAAAIRRTIAANRQEVTELLHTRRRELAALNNGRDRVKRLDASTECPLQAAFDATQSQLTAQIANHEATIKFIGIVENLLTEYEFTIKQPPPPTYY